MLLLLWQKQIFCIKERKGIFLNNADPGMNTRNELICFAVFFFKRTKSKV